ncbi:UDP-glucuronic acid decarboxylase 1 [Podochytrium sp. JEL0797]|nr:UDP-glucuronic acid decarboxylase 1 [Podochytrium sp. JEL0797]
MAPQNKKAKLEAKKAAETKTVAKDDSAKKMIKNKPQVTHVKTDAIPLASLRELYLGKYAQRPVEDKDGMVTFEPKHGFPAVKKLHHSEQKRVLVTGGAGFVGSHLIDRLMVMGHSVICVDNLFTGFKRNVQHWVGHPNFDFIRHDVVDPLMVEVDQIFHLACPASPPHYQHNPVKTIKTSMLGTINMLGLAKRTHARILLASTSEVYGDPEQHPQKETYWGHVNPIGIRACYDEGKRIAETMAYEYERKNGVEVRVVRIFNTFGPRMNPEDGRVVSNFICQALKGEQLTVYGGGAQTRSFQYVHDLVDGMIALMNSEYSQPVNMGNPDEYTILEFAESIRDLVNPDATIKDMPMPKDDPQRRKPDITRAKEVVGWEPQFSVLQGVEETVEYFKSIIDIL